MFVFHRYHVQPFALWSLIFIVFGMEFSGVEIAEVIVKERLASNEFSDVFRVIIRDNVCVMKVVSELNSLGIIIITTSGSYS